MKKNIIYGNCSLGKLEYVMGVDNRFMRNLDLIERDGRRTV